MQNKTSWFVMTFLFLLVSIYTVASGANWMLIDRHVKRDLYIDMSSVKIISKSKVRYWTIITDPNKSPSSGGYKDYIEIDCQKKRTRSVKSETEDQEVNNGIVTVYSNKPITWDAIEPDSCEEQIYEKLCGKKK
jgi:hypothetical protein